MTEKNYVKAILRNLNCSSKTRKQFHDTLIQMITEKKEKGMSMAEIIDTIGDPEEVSNEMNAYLSEKNGAMPDFVEPNDLLPRRSSSY